MTGPGLDQAATAPAAAPRRAHVATAFTFLALLAAAVIAHIFYTPPAVSQAERRPLATFPALTPAALADASFMDAFEDYAADSFPARDAFRTIKAATVFGLYRQLDNAGLYVSNGSAGQFEALDEASLLRVAAKIGQVAESLGDVNVYYSFVPDKSAYADRYYPGFDPVRAAELFQAALPDYTFVDLTGHLTADDFYRTDLHWDQTRLQPVVAAVTAAFGVRAVVPEETVAAGQFSGVYAGQLALPLEADTMAYVELPAAITAAYLNPDTLEFEPGPVYDLALFQGQDPYDLFLRGAQAVVVLENPDAATDRELVYFRDSFGSSLAPLLAGSYARVTLVDLRYIDSRLLPDLIDVPAGSDVWFSYSSQILNHDTVLLVR